MQKYSKEQLIEFFKKYFDSVPTHKDLESFEKLEILMNKAYNDGLDDGAKLAAYFQGLEDGQKGGGRHEQ